jgi:hypothetical protein
MDQEENEKKESSTTKTKKTPAQRQKTIRAFIVLLGGLLLFSGIILAILFFMSDRETGGKTVEYNNYQFKELEDGKWNVEIQSLEDKLYSIPLYFNPYQVEDVSVDTNPKQFLELVLQTKGRAAYVTFDPTASNFSPIALAATELSVNLAQVLNIQPIAACTMNKTDVCVDRPIINCSQTDRLTIYLKESEQTNVSRIYRDQGCFVLEGDKKNLVRSVDRFLFELYGIM